MSSPDRRLRPSPFVGEEISEDEAAKANPHYPAGGWFDYHGRRVYACDGTHRDGFRGWRILQLDGMK